MKIRIGNRTIDVYLYCYMKCGDTENMAYSVDGRQCLDFNSVIDKVSTILADELDKEYENENHRRK